MEWTHGSAGGILYSQPALGSTHPPLASTGTRPRPSTRSTPRRRELYASEPAGGDLRRSRLPARCASAGSARRSSGARRDDRRGRRPTRPQFPSGAHQCLGTRPTKHRHLRQVTAKQVAQFVGKCSVLLFESGVLVDENAIGAVVRIFREVRPKSWTGDPTKTEVGTRDIYWPACGSSWRSPTVAGATEKGSSRRTRSA